MSLSYKVSVLAQEHTRLVSELAKLEYAPGALKTAKTYVADLKTQIIAVSAELKAAKKAEDVTGVELHEFKHAALRNITYRATGQKAKWDAKASKVERAYVDARERRVNAEASLRSLKATLSESEQNVETLTGEVAQRDALLREQLQMYSHVFDGPTPEAPQDDQLEWIVKRNEEESKVHQAALDLETQTLASLQDAKKMLDNCLHKMQEAQNRRDTDLLSSKTADMWESQAITAAQIFAQHFESAYATAQRSNPAVNALPVITLPKTDPNEVRFNNIWDNEQVRRVWAGISSVKETGRALCLEITRTEERIKRAEEKVEPVAEALTRARANLLAFRKTTFEAFASQAAPPDYTEEAHAAAAAPPPPPPEPVNAPPYA
ncbi:hypothetical protein EXIGLDRAFT_137509 [Exidia glandulosa HHB12029]|uniref:Uncharacterized protein n=1 Tax=Exidia glandulosa HHB12029 TaxID=1314781 RepID=A0A165G0U4_EXIGL|nr:hypothetical protein EXIGLDRAFT_137509 [Exidia glandulosa HHB12029]